jgi:hypothetical protein
MTCLEDRGCLTTWNASSSNFIPTLIYSNSLEIGDSTDRAGTLKASLGDYGSNLFSELASVGFSLSL